MFPMSHLQVTSVSRHEFVQDGRGVQWVKDPLLSNPLARVRVGVLPQSHCPQRIYFTLVQEKEDDKEMVGLLPDQSIHEYKIWIPVHMQEKLVLGFIVQMGTIGSAETQQTRHAQRMGDLLRGAIVRVGKVSRSACSTIIVVMIPGCLLLYHASHPDMFRELRSSHSHIPPVQERKYAIFTFCNSNIAYDLAERYYDQLRMKSLEPVSKMQQVPTYLLASYHIRRCQILTEPLRHLTGGT